MKDNNNSIKENNNEKDTRTKLGEYLLSFEEVYNIKLSSAVVQNQRLYYYRGIYFHYFRKRPI